MSHYHRRRRSNSDSQRLSNIITYGDDAETGVDSCTDEQPKSPDSECSICLGTFNDRCYTNKCQHLFCFPCLLEWSKVKRECPLCKKKFDKIYHHIRSCNDMDTYKVPEPLEPDRYRIETNYTWGMMAQVRSRQLAMRRRMLLAVRNATYRAPTFHRNALMPTTSEFRRHIYQYNLYCEGASQPGRASAYRRVTPEFYRSNPACSHRLVPWLNRELIAILPHQDNVQFVLEHILSLIKRIDLRSDQFRRAIAPYTLRYTDHFMHELYMFAVSPLDMAGFDRYAKYPSRPRSTQTRPRSFYIPETSPGVSAGSAALTSSLVERNSDDSSDSDIIAVEQPASSAHPLSYRGSLHAQVSRGCDARTSGHSSIDRLAISSTRPRSHTPQRQRRSRWDDIGSGMQPSTSYDNREIQHRERAMSVTLERFERGLDRSMEVINSIYHNASQTRPSTVSIATPSTSVQISGSSNVVERVRIFLNSAQGSGTSVEESQSMPMLEDLAQSPHQPPHQSSPPVSLIPADNTASESISDSALVSGDVATSLSPASSHSSDVIFVSEKRPWTERSPVYISSDSENEVHVQKSETRVRHLSSSNSDGQRKSRISKPPLHDELPVYRRCRTPSLSSESSYDYRNDCDRSNHSYRLSHCVECRSTSKQYPSSHSKKLSKDTERSSKRRKTTDQSDKRSSKDKLERKRKFRDDHDKSHNKKNDARCDDKGRSDDRNGRSSNIRQTSAENDGLLAKYSRDSGNEDIRDSVRLFGKRHIAPHYTTDVREEDQSRKKSCKKHSSGHKSSR